MEKEKDLGGHVPHGGRGDLDQFEIPQLSHAAACQRLVWKWRGLMQEQTCLSLQSDSRGDGENSHTERARARIYRECANDLAAVIGSGTQASLENSVATRRSAAP